MRGIGLFALLGCSALGCTESGRVLGPGRDGRLASAVSAGMFHACAIVDGVGYCWGGNRYGQLGTGDTDTRDLPAPIAELTGPEQLCTGEAHSCAIDTAGDVSCWGDNRRGQLGNGTRDPALLPEPVALPAPAREISCSFNHSCALLDDDTLHCWGQNGEGELGQDDDFPGDGSLAADGLSPLPISGAWRSVDTGQGHTCAVAVDGALFCWGRNSFYELGSEPQGQVRAPLRVGSATDWETVDAGQNHSCGLRRDGTLWCWGRNTASDGEEGFPLGIEGFIVSEPTRVGTDSAWAELATSIFHTCARSRSGALYCWGRNIEGQLGLGGEPLIRSPEPVPGAFSAVATGGFFSCAIRLDGAPACAGENADGQLGTGDGQRRNEFTTLASP